MVHLVITGGYGFLGVQAARRFLRAGVCWSRLAGAPMPIQKLTLFDRIPLPDHLPEDLTHDPRLKFLSGNLAEDGIVDEVLDLAACDGDVAVIHFASMVSGDTELQPAAGWQANVDSQRVVLDALGAMQFKDRAPGARFLFTSSTAAIGAVPPGGAYTTKLRRPYQAPPANPNPNPNPNPNTTLAVTLALALTLTRTRTRCGARRPDEAPPTEHLRLPQGGV